MTVIVLLSAAFAAPDAATLRAAWEAEQAAIAQHGAVPASFDARDFETLATGEPVAHRVDTAAGAFASGAVWVDSPIAMAWVAIQDAKDRPIGQAITNQWLPGETADRRQIHMLLDLPWPMADRQWVAEMVNNRPLYEATHGQVWQRRWTLADPALASDPDPSAVWVDENQGAWTLIPAGDGTLAVMAVRSVIGGSMPAEITQAWANSVLRRTLRTFAEMAPGTAAHYGARHPVILAPDGSPVPRG